MIKDTNGSRYNRITHTAQMKTRTTNDHVVVLDVLFCGEKINII